MLKDYLLRNNLITVLWYWNPWQEAKERNTKVILISLRGFLSQKGIQCRLSCTSAYLLPCLWLSFQIFQSQKREMRDRVMHAWHTNKTASPALKEVRLRLRKSWGTLLKGDGVRWGQRGGSGLTDRKRLRREAEKPRVKWELPSPYPPLTLRISPRLKLSSSSAVALKSYLAMASMLGLPRTAVRAVGRKRSPKPPLLPRPGSLRDAGPVSHIQGGRGTIRPRGGGGGGRDGPLGEVARIDGRGRAQGRSLRPARRGRRFLPPPLAQARLARVTRPVANGRPDGPGGGRRPRGRHRPAGRSRRSPPRGGRSSPLSPGSGTASPGKAPAAGSGNDGGTERAGGRGGTGGAGPSISAHGTRTGTPPAPARGGDGRLRKDDALLSPTRKDHAAYTNNSGVFPSYSSHQFKYSTLDKAEDTSLGPLQQDFRNRNAYQKVS